MAAARPLLVVRYEGYRQRKKTAWSNTPGYSTTPVYSLTNPPVCDLSHRCSRVALHLVCRLLDYLVWVVNCISSHPNNLIVSLSTEKASRFLGHNCYDTLLPVTGRSQRPAAAT